MDQAIGATLGNAVIALDQAIGTTLGNAVIALDQAIGTTLGNTVIALDQAIGATFSDTVVTFEQTLGTAFGQAACTFLQAFGTAFGQGVQRLADGGGAGARFGAQVLVFGRQGEGVGGKDGQGQAQQQMAFHDLGAPLGGWESGYGANATLGNAREKFIGIMVTIDGIDTEFQRLWNSVSGRQSIKLANLWPGNTLAIRRVKAEKGVRKYFAIMATRIKPGGFSSVRHTKCHRHIRFKPCSQESPA